MYHLLSTKPASIVVSCGLKRRFPRRRHWPDNNKVIESHNRQSDTPVFCARVYVFCCDHSRNEIFVAVLRRSAGAIGTQVISRLNMREVYTAQSEVVLNSIILSKDSGYIVKGQIFMQLPCDYRPDA